MIVFTPNANSVTRRLGVMMGLLKNIYHMTEREIVECGHKRVYTMDTLVAEIENAGLYVDSTYGVLYKPLPNDMLERLCLYNGDEWRKSFMDALIMFGDSHPDDCANLCVVCQ